MKWIHTVEQADLSAWVEHQLPPLDVLMVSLLPPILSRPFILLIRCGIPICSIRGMLYLVSWFDVNYDPEIECTAGMQKTATESPL